jgi:hypothetical protein
MCEKDERRTSRDPLRTRSDQQGGAGDRQISGQHLPPGFLVTLRGLVAAPRPGQSDKGDQAEDADRHGQ